VLTQGRAEKEAQELRSYLREMLREIRVTITEGELAIQDPARRKISASIFARAEL
jgi:hypothetical protein